MSGKYLQNLLTFPSLEISKVMPYDWQNKAALNRRQAQWNILFAHGQTNCC